MHGVIGLTVLPFLQRMLKSIRLQRCFARVSWIILTLFLGGASLGFGVDWQVLTRVAQARYGDPGESSVNAWQSLLDTASGQSTQDQLRTVNDFFNQRVRWTTDRELFGQEDYWATPLETLALSAGDCEDFSIAKYVTLTNLGVATDQLRLIYVMAQQPGLARQAHMVLAWYATPGAVPLILDNMNPAVLPANARPDLKPVFSFNHSDLWLGGRTSSSGRNPQARMARWQQVLSKTQEEGMTIE